MHNDKLFDRSLRKAVNSNEEWGENEHGYFSFESGTFIPKEDATEKDVFEYRSLPPYNVEVSPSWPGEVTEKKEE
jgi:hypothetical protein